MTVVTDAVINNASIHDAYWTFEDVLTVRIDRQPICGSHAEMSVLHSGHKLSPRNAFFQANTRPKAATLELPFSFQRDHPMLNLLASY
jgi:hypothetical protein